MSLFLQCSFFLANAFLGERIDHSLSAISTVVKMKNKKVILFGKKDILFHVENKIELNLKKGTRVSLFPMRKVVGIKSEGLKYNIKNIQFSPGNKIGTSNEVSKSKTLIELNGSGMIIILPINCFKNVINKFIHNYL